jgi:phosphoribosylformylglycinamidine synthase subunit PurS
VFHSKVNVTLKKSILDPQGKAVEQGIHSLGYESINNVRIGKYIEMDLETDSREEAERITREISEKLLANLVMESYSFTVEQIKEQAE